MISDKLYIYVLVRKDIPIEQQLVQACHASCVAGESFGKSNSSMVLLGVENLDQLLGISEEFRNLRVPFEMFFEPDWDMGYSALATKAVKGAERARIRKMLDRCGIRLWKRPS